MYDHCTTVKAHRNISPLSMANLYIILYDSKFMGSASLSSTSPLFLAFVFSFLFNQCSSSSPFHKLQEGVLLLYELQRVLHPEISLNEKTNNALTFCQLFFLSAVLFVG
jgi:hypothetical protein